MRRSWVWIATLTVPCLLSGSLLGAWFVQRPAKAGEVENVVTIGAAQANSAPCFEGPFARHRSANWIISTPGYSFLWLNDVPIGGPLWLGNPLGPSPVLAPPLTAPAPQAVDRQADAARQPKEPRPVRTSGPTGKARAGKLMGYGDVHFGRQKYLLAAERYKSAVQSAPDLAEPYIRQSLAHAAIGEYESAVKAFRRGLRVRADWSDSPLRLDQLYGADQIAKTAHLETLAKAVEANPFDATLLVALGMQLFFDGQPERSEVFFARAAQLGANEDRLLDRFLPRPGPAGAPRPDGEPRPGGKVVF